MVSIPTVSDCLNTKRLFSAQKLQVHKGSEVGKTQMRVAINCNTLGNRVLGTSLVDGLDGMSLNPVTYKSPHLNLHKNFM